MIVAEYTFGQGLLTVLAVFVFVAWIMVLFTILSDLFRDHGLSGWGKAAWLALVSGMYTVVPSTTVTGRPCHRQRSGSASRGRRPAARASRASTPSGSRPRALQ